MMQSLNMTKICKDNVFRKLVYWTSFTNWYLQLLLQPTWYLKFSKYLSVHEKSFISLSNVIFLINTSEKCLLEALSRVFIFILCRLSYNRSSGEYIFNKSACYKLKPSPSKTCRTLLPPPHYQAHYRSSIQPIILFRPPPPRRNTIWSC